MLSFFSKTDNRIFGLLKILLGLCLVTPLFVSNRLLFPYTAPKAFAFRILVEIAVVFYFYLCLRHPAFRPKKTPLILTVLAFLGIWFLSTLLSVDFSLSFWGDLERMAGFWGLAHFAAFFLMLAAVFKNEKEWRNLLRISVAVSSVAALLAIAQRFVSLGPLLPQVERVYSTIGNAAFLAGYLIFNIFFAGYLFFKEKAYQKILFGGAFILQIIALLLTGTRGAWLGLLAGMIFLLLFFGVFHTGKNFKRYSLILLFSVLVLAGAAFIFRQSNFIKGNFLLQRLTNISLKETTAQNRLILWQSAWTSWQQFPVLGWGPENFGTAINKNFDPRLAPYESWYDRAHNFVFDYGVTLGWLGLAGYLALFGAALFSLKKLLRENFYTVALFASLIIAYLVQSLFVFDVYVTFLMLFFLLALINFSGEKNRISQPAVSQPASFSASKKIAVALIAISVFFALYQFNIKPMSASSLSARIFSLPPEDAVSANPVFEKILSLGTFASPEITYQVILDYLSKANSAPQLTQNEEFYKLASAALAENIKRSPLQVKNYIALSWLNLYFSDRHLERINLAIEQAQRAQDISPYKKEILLLLVAGYSVNNQPDRALEMVGQAEKINEALGAQVRQYWESLNKN